MLELSALAAAGIAGIAIGLGSAIAFRASERARAVQPEPGAVPPGVTSVLAVLNSQAVLLDRDNTIVRTSQAANAYGLVRDRQLASAELTAMVAAVRRTGEIREQDLTLARDRHGDAPMHMQARVAPLGDLVLVLVDDRTESQRLESVRRDFVENVSHELKTPVGAISLLAEAVHDAADDPVAVRRFAGRMQHESERLTSLVRELLELSRVQDDDPLESPEPVDVDTVIGAAIVRAKELAASQSITVDRAGTRGLAILGDQRHLVTAVGNLLDNAIAYSSPGSRVVVSSRADGEMIELAVVDEGVGIAAEDQERIFERFYRVDPARSRATGGTGLGLALVKHIAATHGGEIAVRSDEGVGSTFILRVPAYVPLRDELDLPLPSSREGESHDLALPAGSAPARGRAGR